MSWPIVKLGDVCDLQNGFAFKSSDYIEESNVLNCRMSNIRPTGDFDIFYHPKYLPDTYAQKYNEFLLKDDDVIIAMTDMAGEPKILGVPTIVKTHGKYLLLNQRVGKLIYKSTNTISFDYLRYALSRPSIKNYFRKFSNGGVQINLSKPDLLSVEIPLPPLSEQKRIAAILDKADEIRRKREAAIAKLDQLAQSIFVEMFGDLRTNSKNWKFISIGEALKEGSITEIQDGNHGEIHPKSSDFVEKGIPFIMANCLIDGKIDFEKSYKLGVNWLEKLRIGFAKPNDILLTHKGTIGEVAIVPNTYEKIILSPQTTYYRPSSRLEPSFLIGYFRSDWFQAIIKKEAIQSTRAYIGITRQKDLPIFLPSLEQQMEFAKRISKLEQIRAEYSAALEKQINLFSSLQHAAFSGQL